ncbi:P-loop containing nucleoside triphosphate hydrolase protein [Eremomyces bilateralis CBS 781.70]|uniref:DNA 3'-5' helicase n=1 Tax=Eremomyces bilateralis CBS 781.70 TaxID=1392243 RepID=A0A6G1G4X8_9PEZI|nr:P-loop containing nucleoside triphosphate hydrolase protein [Eremomyces bilateralis CBS 781.70]KAF1813104.1 P-loop containing nucleoside triphosphate hydrolase protein [Eremomyces bilateralis CBS 781.70]
MRVKRRRGRAHQRETSLYQNLASVQPPPIEKTIEERISIIATTPEKELCSVLQELVKACLIRKNIKYQHDIIFHGLQRLLGGRLPRINQVRALRRIVFRYGDTIVSAKTGFGKSIIFHAIPIFIGRIVIQLIPLSKLGEEQKRSIEQLPEARPCLITAETKHTNPKLLQEIAAGLYTHILMGPEQAASDEFRDLLLNPDVKNKIGVVAIDELHVMEQWKEFRLEYLKIRELRRYLRADTIWFGCSATLNKATEQAVIYYGGFYEETHHELPLKIIRVSIDRPDISLNILPIERGKSKAYQRLWFLVDHALEHPTSRTEDDLQRIPKTIIFVDGLQSVANISASLERYLFVQGFEPAMVRDAVGAYTSNTSRYDQDLLYDKIRSPCSSLRVVVATTALGMGMDIPDIMVVAQWGLPIGHDLGDIWQRVGRAVRVKQAINGMAFIFLPYYAFDLMGQDPVQMPSSRNNQPLSQKKKGRRNTLRLPNTTYSQSPLSQGDGAESDCSQQSDNTEAASQENSQSTIPKSKKRGKSDSLPTWTVDELKHRATLPITIRSLANAPCRRQVFLAEFNEDQCEPDTIPIRADKKVCYNGKECNIALFQLPPMPDIPLKSTKPGRETKAGIALNLLVVWCLEQVESIFPRAQQMIPVPAGVVIPQEAQWAIASMYTCVKNSTTVPIPDQEALSALFDIENWEYQNTLLDPLLAFLVRIVLEVCSKHNAILEERKCKRNIKALARKATEGTAQNLESNPQDSSIIPNPSLPKEEKVAQYVRSRQLADDRDGLRVIMHNELLAQKLNEYRETFKPRHWPSFSSQPEISEGSQELGSSFIVRGESSFVSQSSVKLDSGTDNKTTISSDIRAPIPVNIWSRSQTTKRTTHNSSGIHKRSRTPLRGVSGNQEKGQVTRQDRPNTPKRAGLRFSCTVDAQREGSMGEAW